jgi:hypothetical protein
MGKLLTGLFLLGTTVLAQSASTPLASIEQPERFATLSMVGSSPCYINLGDYKGGWNVLTSRVF